MKCMNEQPNSCISGLQRGPQNRATSAPGFGFIPPSLLTAYNSLRASHCRKGKHLKNASYQPEFTDTFSMLQRPSLPPPNPQPGAFTQGHARLGFLQPTRAAPPLLPALEPQGAPGSPGPRAAAPTTEETNLPPSLSLHFTSGFVSKPVGGFQ